MRLSEFHDSVHVDEVLPLPKGLTKVWDPEFVRQKGLRILENEGKGYCGYYVLALVENALLGRRAAPPRTILKRLHTLAELYTNRDAQLVKTYAARPMHWLQDFELSWYLDWLQVNWVLLHYEHGPRNTHLYTAEVQGEPSRQRWVFLINKGHRHWVVLTKSQGRGRARDFEVTFTPEETQLMLLSLGVAFPEEDTRVFMAPSKDPDDYLSIAPPKKASRRHRQAVASQASASSAKAAAADSESDSDSDETFRDDPYR